MQTVERMEKITDIRFEKLEKSIYLKPFRFLYKQDGISKKWDLIGIHDSVSILLYNAPKKCLVYVKQFRPAVYCKNIPESERAHPIDASKYPGSLGITIELCSGIVDKTKSLAQIAKEEVLEECGYDVPLSNLQQLFQYRANVGQASSLLTLFYCEIDDSMKVASGGVHEFIEIIEMSVDEVRAYVNSKNVIQSPGNVVLAFLWFSLNKSK